MIIMEIRYPCIQLEALLSKFKIDADDYLSQIILVGEDLVGAITVEEA